MRITGPQFLWIVVATIVALLIAVYLTAIAAPVQPAEGNRELSYDSNYIILNTEDGTIDSISLRADDQSPAVKEGQVAINAILNFNYAFDIETTVDLNGTPQTYKAYFQMNDAELIWFYNTYFASPDVEMSELIAPQEFLRAQTDSKVYQDLQQQLATVTPNITSNDECGFPSTVAPDIDDLNTKMEVVLGKPMSWWPIAGDSVDRTLFEPCEEIA